MDLIQLGREANMWINLMNMVTSRLKRRNSSHLSSDFEFLKQRSAACSLLLLLLLLLLLIRCAHNTAVIVPQTMCITTMQIELTCGTLCIYKYYECNLSYFTSFKT